MPRARAGSSLGGGLGVPNTNLPHYEHPLPTFVTRVWKKQRARTEEEAYALKLQAVIRGYMVRRFLLKLHAKADARANRMAAEREVLDEMVSPGWCPPRPSPLSLSATHEPRATFAQHWFAMFQTPSIVFD